VDGVILRSAAARFLVCSDRTAPQITTIKLLLGLLNPPRGTSGLWPFAAPRADQGRIGYLPEESYCTAD